MSDIKTLVEVREEATDCPVVPHNENGWKGGSIDEEKKPHKKQTSCFHSFCLSGFIVLKKKKVNKNTEGKND